MPRSEPIQLPLHEEFMLLSLHDQKGTIISAMSGFGIAGALLAELFLREQVRLEQTRWGKLIEAQGTR